MEDSLNQTPEVVKDLPLADSTPDVPDAPDSTPEGEEKEWAPNYKVKAYDKEYEIPEKFRNFINKENEKDFRDTFEKAYALDVMKEKNAKIREANEQYQTRIEKELTPNLQRYQKIEKFLANKDFDSFVENAKINEADLQAWMLKRLQLKDLPPDQQALYNDHRASQLKAYQLEEENLSYKQKFEQQSLAEQEKVVNDQLDLLDKTVSSPEIAAVAQEFDKRLGQDGSFKLEVLRRASVIAKTTGKDITVQEAVNDFLKVLGQQNQGAQPTQEENTEAPQKPKPTLPSLNGKATSPAVQKIKSLDDLKKIAKQQALVASRASRE